MVEPKEKSRSRGKRWALGFLKSFGILVALGLIAGVAVVAIGYQTIDVPDPNKDFQTNTTFVYYRDGKSTLGSLAVQNRQTVGYDQMSKSIKDAVVAAENRSFWSDNGVSIKGMARAAWAIVRGGDVQGGSTITQQYVKVLYLNQDQTFTRKFKELFVAYKVGRQQSKEDVLAGYLNTIYFGRGAYGIQAASKSYFNVDAKDLTVPQAAVLASVLNNPGLFDPSEGDSNSERLLERYRYVLQGMADLGSITPEQHAKYAKSLPEFPDIPVNARYAGPKGFLMKMVEDELVAAGFDQGQLNGGGYKVITTFDKDAQRAAVKAAQSKTKEAAKAADQKAKGLHAAIASVDVNTGEVLALYGGPNYIKNSRNWATTPRPTGSTFKAFALAAGLENGFSLRSVFNGNTFTPPGDSVPVRNEFSRQYGPVNLIKATADSINTAFVDLTTQMRDGPAKIATTAQDAGAVKPNGGPGWEENSRIPLGVAEVSPLNMANAYATLANDGKHNDDHVVREVRDRNNKVVWKSHTKDDRAISKDVSHDVTYALSGVVEEGTGRSVSTLGRPVAGKTGTAGVKDDVVSAWFVAYTKQISTAVMYVAGDSGNSDLDPYARPGDSTFFGGTYPAQTWSAYMEKATEGMPVEQFPPPAWVHREQAPQQVPMRTRTRAPQPQQPDVKPTKKKTEKPSKKPSETPSKKPSDKPTTTKTSDEPTTQPPNRPTTTKPPNKPTTKPPTTKPTTTKSTSKTSQKQNVDTGGGNPGVEPGNPGGGQTGVDTGGGGNG